MNTCSPDSLRAHSQNQQGLRFTKKALTRVPLLIDQTRIEMPGTNPIAAYIAGCLIEVERKPSEFRLPVYDQYLRPLTLVVAARETRDGLTGFWQSPFCNHDCAQRTFHHPCAEYTSDDCDLFCAGSSSFGDDAADDDEDADEYGSVPATRNLMRAFSCQEDAAGHLSSCSILAIMFHRSHRGTADPVLLSIVLTVGCDAKHQSILVIQSHLNRELTFSLR
jgi:hypothetical protein